MSDNQTTLEFMISLDYHGIDEIVNRQETTLTRNEIRSLMIWMQKQRGKYFPSENCEVAFVKLHWLLIQAHNDITSNEAELPEPLDIRRQAE